jgi:hypothetical protein
MKTDGREAEVLKQMMDVEVKVLYFCGGQGAVRGEDN